MLRYKGTRCSLGSGAELHLHSVGYWKMDSVSHLSEKLGNPLLLKNKHKWAKLSQRSCPIWTITLKCCGKCSPHSISRFFSEKVHFKSGILLPFGNTCCSFHHASHVYFIIKISPLWQSKMQSALSLWWLEKNTCVNDLGHVSWRPEAYRRLNRLVFLSRDTQIGTLFLPKYEQ